MPPLPMNQKSRNALCQCVLQRKVITHLLHGLTCMEFHEGFEHVQLGEREMREFVQINLDASHQKGKSSLSTVPGVACASTLAFFGSLRSDQSLP